MSKLLLQPEAIFFGWRRLIDAKHEESVPRRAVEFAASTNPILLVFLRQVKGKVTRILKVVSRGPGKIGRVKKTTFMSSWPWCANASCFT